MSATGPGQRPSYENLERNVEEVRVHDLERKGIDRVRVLRPVDIERMIQGVLAEALVASNRQGEELVQQTRQALLQRMKETQAQIQAADRAEAEIDRLKGANAALAGRVREARERLARAEAALRELDAEAERLEAEGREIEAAEPPADAPGLAEALQAAETAEGRRVALEAELRAMGAQA